MNNIYTIGFTQKTAQQFFEILKNNNIDILIDIRRKNTSQLASFAKYPDLKYFLKVIDSIEYINDLKFAPSEILMKKYKNKKINWEEYVNIFNMEIKENNIEKYIKKEFNFVKDKKVCLLCSEAEANKCHRRLIAEKFAEIYKMRIVNL